MWLQLRSESDGFGSEQGRWAAGRCRHLLPAFTPHRPTSRLRPFRDPQNISSSPPSSHPVPGALPAFPGSGLPTARAPGMGSGPGAASWAQTGVCSTVKIGGSSLRAFSLLWHLPHSSPEQCNLGPMQSRRGPWTPLQHAPLMWTPLRPSGEGSAVVYE